LYFSSFVFLGETSGGIYNITFINNVIAHAGGPYIKTSRGRGGVIEAVTYKNITILNCLSKILYVDMNYDHVPNPGNKTTTPVIKDVYFSDINANCADNPGSFLCLPESPCTEFRMDNVHIKQTTNQYECQYVTGSSSDDEPPSCFGFPHYNK